MMYYIYYGYMAYKMYGYTNTIRETYNTCSYVYCIYKWFTSSGIEKKIVFKKFEDCEDCEDWVKI